MSDLKQNKKFCQRLFSYSCALLSFMILFNGTILLAMDPLTIGKGAEALGEKLGVVEKKTSEEAAITTQVVISSSEGSCPLEEEEDEAMAYYLQTHSAEYSGSATSSPLNLETEIETGGLSQYTLPQNVFSELSHVRTPKRHGEPGLKVCHGSVKTILEQSPYEISSSSIPVSRLNSPSSESSPFFSENALIASSSSDSFNLKRKREKEVLEEASVRKQLKEHEDGEAIQQLQSTIAHISPEVQQVIAVKRREGETAFARARIANSESAWNEAKETALAISNDWNGIVGEIKTGINSLVMSQKEAAMQRDYWKFKADIAEIKALNEAPWPEGNCYSTNSENRGEEMNMIIRYKIWPIVSEAMRLFIQHPSKEKMLTMRQVASDVTSVSSDSFGFTGATGENREASYIVAATFAFTALSTSTFASASEVFEAVSMVNDLANEAKAEFNKMKDYQHWWLHDEEDHLNWVVSVACETEDFIRAVAQYKVEQETTIVEGNGQRKIEDANQELATVAREVFTVATMRDIQEPLKEKKANVLKKMICKKFGLPVSNIMQEFMAHPNEATLRATNNPFLVAMSAAEAEETMEIIKIARCDGIIYDYFTKEQNEKLKFAQLLEFFRAIAKFKREQEEAVITTTATNIICR